MQGDTGAHLPDSGLSTRGRVGRGDRGALALQVDMEGETKAAPAKAWKPKVAPPPQQVRKLSPEEKGAEETAGYHSGLLKDSYQEPTG